MHVEIVNEYIAVFGITRIENYPLEASAQYVAISTFDMLRAEDPRHIPKIHVSLIISRPMFESLYDRGAEPFDICENTEKYGISWNYVGVFLPDIAAIHLSFINGNRLRNRVC